VLLPAAISRSLTFTAGFDVVVDPAHKFTNTREARGKELYISTAITSKPRKTYVTSQLEQATSIIFSSYLTT
jgi:hypothetical protein